MRDETQIRAALAYLEVVKTHSTAKPQEKVMAYAEADMLRWVLGEESNFAGFMASCEAKRGISFSA